MTTHLVTFATENMSKSAQLCAKSAFDHGVQHTVHIGPVIPSEELNQRGVGFWKWKPRTILYLMTNIDSPPIDQVADGDIMIYADAGVEFINNVNYIIDRMDQDIWLFGNNYQHAHWCKRDIIESVFPGVGWERFREQVQASVIFFRVNDKSRAFVKEWLDWCLFEGGRLIDDSPSITPNHPEFKENRHDQAILTTLAYREWVKLHWWPAMYNDGAFTYERGNYPDEGIPVLFHHHRRRNHGMGKGEPEWPS